MIKLKTLIFESLSPIEAEQIFSRYGVPNASELSKEDLKKVWRELSKTFHPDKNPSKKDEMNLAMQWINSAYSVLNSSPKKSSGEKSYDDYYSNNVYQYQQDRQQSNRKTRTRTSDTHYAGWAQAGWSGGLPNNDHIYNQNFQDLNYCKKTAGKYLENHHLIEITNIVSVFGMVIILGEDFLFILYRINCLRFLKWYPNGKRSIELLRYSVIEK